MCPILDATSRDDKHYKLYMSTQRNEFTVENTTSVGKMCD